MKRGIVLNIRVTDTKSLKEKLNLNNSPFEPLQNYVNSRTKILFNKRTCEHPPFLCTPNNILKSINDEYDCPDCAKIKRLKSIRDNSNNTLAEFNKAFLLNDTSNLYKLVENQEYINNKCKVKVLCLKCNNEFGISLVNARKGRGCPNCNLKILNKRGSKASEIAKKVLNEMNVDFESEYSFNDLRNDNDRLLYFDFYLHDLNACIEIDGKQHYEPVNFLGSQKISDSLKSFERCKINDDFKNKYCLEKGIALLRVSYKENTRKSVETFVQRLSLGN